MLGPNYGKWWNEQPRYARLRYGLIILPFILIIAWMFYLYRSGAYLHDDIFEAVESGNICDIRALFSDGAYADARQDNGTSLLHHAIEMDHIEIVPLLIKEGADVNAMDYRDLTPIHLAAGKGHTMIVKLLIESGADPGVNSKQYGSPLHWAANSGHIEILRFLLDEGVTVDPQDRWGRTPFQYTMYLRHAIAD